VPILEPGLLREACHRAGHFGPDPLAGNDGKSGEADRESGARGITPRKRDAALVIGLASRGE